METKGAGSQAKTQEQVCTMLEQAWDATFNLETHCPWLSTEQARSCSFWACAGHAATHAEASS